MPCHKDLQTTRRDIDGLSAGIHRNLRLIKPWIGSERPITNCAIIVKTWLWQCDVTRRQRPMRALVSFTLQRKLHTNMRTNMRRTQPLGYSPQPGCSGRPVDCTSGELTFVTGIVSIACCGTIFHKHNASDNHVV